MEVMKSTRRQVGFLSIGTLCAAVARTHERPSAPKAVSGLTGRDLELWAHRQSCDPLSPFYRDPVNVVLASVAAK